MKVEFVASFSPIVREAAASAAVYRDALGVSFEGGDGEYVFTERLDGVKHLDAGHRAAAEPRGVARGRLLHAVDALSSL